MWDAVYIFNEVFIDTETNTIVLVTVLWLLRDTIMAYSIGFWRTVLDYKSIIIMVGGDWYGIGTVLRGLHPDPQAAGRK